MSVPDFLSPALIRDLVITLIYLGVLIGVRSLLRRAILAREGLEPEMKQRWLVSVRNVIFLLLLLGITLIWAREIQTVALSLVAIAAALVLATREMILCLLGSLYRSSTHAYTIGDRIEINGLKGQVIDTSLMSTTLIESNQAVAHKSSVGRLVTFPNSLLLTHPAYNESALGRFVIHTVHISLSRNSDWARAEQVLLAAAKDVMTPYSADMVRQARELQRRYGLGSPSLVPRVRLSLSEHDKVDIYLQLTMPLNERLTLEQRLLRQFLQAMAIGHEKAGTSPAVSS